MERSMEKQAQEMTRAAREMTQAARELRRAVDRLTELHQRPNRASALTELLGFGGLSEEEAERLVREAVHEVRAEISRSVSSARPTKRSYPLPPRRRQRSGSVAGKSAVSARVTAPLNAPLIVLDTGVVVRALTGRPDSASSEVVRAVQTAEVRLAVSDAFLIETTRVLREPRAESRIGSAGRPSRSRWTWHSWGATITPRDTTGRACQTQ
jgi:hypothetical protein